MMAGEPVIERLDPYAEADLTQLQRLLEQASAVDAPDQAPPCPLDTIGATRFAWPDGYQEDHLARVEGQVVGAVRVLAPASGSGDAKIDQLVVHPAWRRRGIGGALLARARAMAKDCDALTVEVSQARRTPRPDDAAGGLFLAAMGAAPLRHLLHLRLDAAALRDAHTARLAAEYAAATGYSLVHWGSAVPPALLADIAEMSAQLNDASPVAAAERIRALERMRAGRQRRAWETGIRHDASGRLVAVSSLTMTYSAVDRALQGLTVVCPDQRRQGLATLVKLANLFHAGRYVPTLSVVDTYNEVTNEPVVALNHALGFRHVGDVKVWQVKL